VQDGGGPDGLSRSGPHNSSVLSGKTSCTASCIAMRISVTFATSSRPANSGVGNADPTRSKFRLRILLEQLCKNQILK
jgi:hypothetical protein